MVLDVNFINPYKTAGFLFFDDKDDAKKTDNSVVKVKGCLVDVHVDINNLPVFPSDHQILIVSQCLMISWEKSIIEKIIQPNSETLAVVQRQFFFLCGKYMSTILIDNRDYCTICSAAIPFSAWKNPAKIHNKDDFCKPVVNCRTGNRPNQTNTCIKECRWQRIFILSLTVVKFGRQVTIC